MKRALFLVAALVAAALAAVAMSGWPVAHAAKPADLSAQDAQSALDFADASDWNQAAKKPPRQSDTQLMILDILDIVVPGQLQAADANLADPGNTGDAPSATENSSATQRGFAARIWTALTHPSLASRSSYPLGFTRSAWRGGQGVTRPTRVHAYLTSLGSSTGEAFDIQLVNDGSVPVQIGGDGVVVEPIKKGTEGPIRAELQQISNRRPPTTVRANAYCLEFKLKPPEQGNMFRVSDAPTQKKYAAAREILRASRRLQQSGQLVADSNATDYFHAIRQWALWTAEQRFTLASYRDAFIDRSKRNVQALGAKWNKEVEDGLKALVPHRWDEITKILREAGQPPPR